ncbi:MAG: hypothetical protein GY754_28060 [bacterium]|nr:hypothetical protein [bacterium]
MDKIRETAPQAIRELFEENELQLIVELHYGSDYDPKITYRPKLLELRIMESDNLDEVAGKWEVDPMTVVGKIDMLSFEDIASLIEWACSF